ncbi:MAG: hypothetical protein IMZ66_04070 [Planctomycetes bacterium]|nr:hypothetical protein [Planctomycetota bacterium]
MNKPTRLRVSLRGPYGPRTRRRWWPREAPRPAGLAAAALAALGLAALAFAAPAPAADAPARTAVWMMPPSHDGGRCFRELFEQPDAWKETRALVGVLGYADHLLTKQFTDDQLRAWLPMLKAWGLRLALEVGAVKPWGRTGEKTFGIQRPQWDRVRRLGGDFFAVAMDEPLCCARKEIGETDDYAVRETAAFIALVRQHYPDVLVGDIEPYPFIPMPDLLKWIDALQKRLAEMKVRGLDFFRLDVNWVEFTVHGRGSWREVRQLELACRRQGLPFSLIYWASDYPEMKRRGLADDATWYVSVMRQGYDYAAVDGSPDEFVVESWIDAPSRGVPETGEFTFTRSVRDFVRRFVGRGR